MCNMYTKFVKFLEICKQFSYDLVTDKGNIPRSGPIPCFSDLEVIALSMAAETEEIDSENWLFGARLKECRDSMPNRQLNDRKAVSGLQEQIRSRMAKEMDGGEDYFCIDSRPIEVCRMARRKRCKMGKDGDFAQAPDFGYCASQGIYFFGYKLHVLCGLSGVIHSYDISKASVHDINFIKDIRHEYCDCSIFGDKGYIGAEVQLDLFKTANIRLECPYRLNQKNWKPTLSPLLRRGRDLRRCSHNLLTSSSSSGTTPRKPAVCLPESSAKPVR